jgi:hypothetical protein
MRASEPWLVFASSIRTSAMGIYPPFFRGIAASAAFERLQE